MSVNYNITYQPKDFTEYQEITHLVENAEKLKDANKKIEILSKNYETAFRRKKHYKAQLKYQKNSNGPRAKVCAATLGLIAGSIIGYGIGTYSTTGQLMIPAFSTGAAVVIAKAIGNCCGSSLTQHALESGASSGVQKGTESAVSKVSGYLGNKLTSCFKNSPDLDIDSDDDDMITV